MKTMIRLGLMMVMGLMANGVRADEGANKGVAVATPAAPQSTPKAKHATAKAVKKSTATVKKKKTEAPAAEADQYVWVCPMGDFTGTKPGKCPTCGMDLVKVKKSDLKKQ
ncbi:MAG TPA: heavy metal-binding domain-containing protein [bacterium]|nr:heavy metal-binding domain-containing protein [bacterium]